MVLTQDSTSDSSMEVSIGSMGSCVALGLLFLIVLFGCAAWFSKLMH